MISHVYLKEFDLLFLLFMNPSSASGQMTQLLCIDSVTLEPKLADQLKGKAFRAISSLGLDHSQ